MPLELTGGAGTDPAGHQIGAVTQQLRDKGEVRRVMPGAWLSGGRGIPRLFHSPLTALLLNRNDSEPPAPAEMQIHMDPVRGGNRDLIACHSI